MLLVESPQKDFHLFYQYCFNYNTFLSYDCTLDVLTVKQLHIGCNDIFWLSNSLHSIIYLLHPTINKALYSCDDF